MEFVGFLYSFLLISDTHATFCLTRLQLFSFNFSNVTADHKLYGRACCWTGLIWNCVSGDTLTANHDSSIMIADIVVAYKDYRQCIRSLTHFILQAKCLETGETVAIKKVLQDKRYKNRELQTMRLLDHPNVVSLKHCFFSTTEKDELYLNLVLEYVPETVYRVAKHYSKANQRMPMIYVKLYTYQVSYTVFMGKNAVILNVLSYSC